jgi:hypothetical protein
LERDRLDSCFNGGGDEDRIHGCVESVETYVLSAAEYLEKRSHT